jgi:hypothetical protein
MAAREKGNRNEVYVYEFLKDPLVRMLGKDVYKQICIAAKEFRKDKTGDRHQASGNRI